jgi:hypothetical protein
LAVLGHVFRADLDFARAKTLFTPDTEVCQLLGDLGSLVCNAAWRNSKARKPTDSRRWGLQASLRKTIFWMLDRYFFACSLKNCTIRSGAPSGTSCPPG